MAQQIEWLDGQRIKVPAPRRPKKCTGTRFGAVLGVNKWATPFEAWCAITRTWEKPFEDTKYTVAGKVIEPKQAEYMKRAYAMYNLVTPADLYGQDYFRTTRGDFFPAQKELGGMWDYLVNDENGKVTTVLEMKTTKRAEDWQTDIPEYYALQAALYAYLLGVDNVIMVCSFLAESDYEAPENFVPSAENTITREFKVSERYPDFADMVNGVLQWWKDHVETGISPAYDEKKDAEILAALRTNTLSPDTDIAALITEAEEIKRQLDAVKADNAEKEKRLSVINDIIKQHAVEQFRNGDSKVELGGSRYQWTIAKTESTSIDKEAMQADGILEKYQKRAEQYRLTVKEI